MFKKTKIVLSYFFRLSLLIGGILLITILPILKMKQKKIFDFSMSATSIALLVLSLTALLVVCFIYGLHKKINIPGIKLPKPSDESKKALKKLGFIVAILLIWWYWHPLKEKILSVIEKRPGVEQKAIINDNKKEVVEVAKERKKEEKVSYHLKWEKPRNQRLSYIDFSDGRSDVISFEENGGGMKFTIRNPSKKNEDMICSLQVFNGRESCGTWNGKNIYNESETVWKWKGGYIDHQGRKGQIFLTEVFSNNETKYVGKASLPNRPDKWVNLVIYQ